MPTWRKIWIAELVISPSAKSKVGLKHGIDPSYIKRYVEGNPQLLAVERWDEFHGIRTYFVIPYTNRFDLEIFIQLEDLNYSTWSLRTARLIPSSKKKK